MNPRTLYRTLDDALSSKEEGKITFKFDDHKPYFNKMYHHLRNVWAKSFVKYNPTYAVDVDKEVKLKEVDGDPIVSVSIVIYWMQVNTEFVRLSTASTPDDWHSDCDSDSD